MDFITGKPRSVLSIKSDVTYNDIMSAIANNNLTDKNLRAIVSLCRANPSNVLCVVYKSFENAVLMVFGAVPTCAVMEGSKLQSLMSAHCGKSKIYIFTYVKE